MDLKKILIAALAVLMCFLSFTACNTDSEGTGSELSENSQATESSEPDTEDSKMPEYWGFNDYNRVNIVGAPEEILSYPTTVTMESKTKYSISCETDGGTLTVTLEERSWGCFNIWSWFIIDNNGERIAFGGSTDYEYVHRATVANGQVVWTGGNHANEAFVSMELYNAETHEKLGLKVGDSVTVNSLHVIEKTKLLALPDSNGDSIGDYSNKKRHTYTDEDVYAEVTRKYTFTGPQIKLNVDYKYVQDMQHEYSYTCMMPINKSVGQICEMYDHNGTLVNTIVTPAAGRPGTAGSLNGGNSASRAVVYSENSPYKFDVRVTTIQDSLDNYNSQNKTAFWDMNSGTNKLYFSKFFDGSKNAVKAGDEFHTESIWLFQYTNDAE